MHEIEISDFIIISVGELNKNKNHEVIIRAVAALGIPEVKYLIVGTGNLKEHLVNVIRDLGMEKQVYLLGYRTDIRELLFLADIFAFPSFREGLGLAAIEAMCCGLPLLTSDRHGINDYSVDGVSGYKCNPNNVEGFVEGIRKLRCNKELRRVMGIVNMARAKRYDRKEIKRIMDEIY